MPIIDDRVFDRLNRVLKLNSQVVSHSLIMALKQLDENPEAARALIQDAITRVAPTPTRSAERHLSQRLGVSEDFLDVYTKQAPAILPMLLDQLALEIDQEQAAEPEAYADLNTDFFRNLASQLRDNRIDVFKALLDRQDQFTRSFIPELALDWVAAHD